MVDSRIVGGLMPFSNQDFFSGLKWMSMSEIQKRWCDVSSATLEAMRTVNPVGE
jgi:hypothetical protein